MEKVTKPKNLLINLCLPFMGGFLFIFQPSLSFSSWKYKGVCYDADWENSRSWYGTRKALAQLEKLPTLGVNSISVTPFAFQSHVNRPFIRFKKEFDKGLEKDVKRAKERGLKVIFKPHIWSDQFWDGSGYWRGSISMQTRRDWKDWFNNYTKMITHFAREASRLEVDLFVVGLEYVKTTKSHKKEWKKVIQEVRKIYKGPITYAANNLEEAKQIKFWEDLDFIGINAYFPIAENKEPTLEELKSSWWRIRADLHKFSKKNSQKKILLTEIGYSSADGTAMKPYEWPHKNSKSDEKEQAMSYQAMFTVLKNAPWLEGMFIWKYKVGVTPASLSREPSESFFVFQNKLAENIIKENFTSSPN